MKERKKKKKKTGNSACVLESLVLVFFLFFVFLVFLVCVFETTSPLLSSGRLFAAPGSSAVHVPWRYSMRRQGKRWRKRKRRRKKSGCCWLFWLAATHFPDWDSGIAVTNTMWCSDHNNLLSSSTNTTRHKGQATLLFLLSVCFSLLRLEPCRTRCKLSQACRRRARFGRGLFCTPLGNGSGASSF